MNISSRLRKRLVVEATAPGDKSEPSSLTPRKELLVVGIMVPTLGVLVAWLASALGLPPMWTQVLVMTLGLVLVMPYMMRQMQLCTQTEIDGTLCTAPTHLATDASKLFEAQDYEGWYGLMENLTSTELEFLTELVDTYLEKQDDLNQPEWGFAHGVLDKLNATLESVHAH